MNNWENIIINGITNNKPYTDIVKELKQYFPERTEESLNKKVRDYAYRHNIKRGPCKDIKQTILKDLNKGVTLSDIKSYNASIDDIVLALNNIKSEGYYIENDNGLYKINNVPKFSTSVLNRNWNGEKVIRFALVSDTHINSKYTQLTYLHKFYDFIKSEGIDTVYHCGDIDEGEQMRPGHQYECYNQGADDHVKEIVRVYPKREGVKTHFITGNHDNSFIKRCGLDIGYRIAGLRDDMIYLGNSNAVVYITPNCKFELQHPGDGSAYAMSYKPQKMIDAMMGGEKPNILAIGHYHKHENLLYRNIHCYQAATFESMTPFMKSKGLSCQMGGWIIELNVNDEGYITRIKSEFIPYYKAIKDDYLNFRDFTC